MAKEAEVKQEVEMKEINTTGAEVEMKEIRLIRDDDHKEPQFVGVNGRGYLVERGKKVKVPASVYEVLMNAEDQKEKALDYQDSKAFND